MSEIRDVLQYDWGYVFLGILLIAVAFQFAIKLFDWFIEKMGISTRRTRDREEQIKAMETTNTKVTDLESAISIIQNQLAELYEETEQTEINITGSLTELTDILNKVVETVDRIDKCTAVGNKANVEIMHDLIKRKCNGFIQKGSMTTEERDWLVRSMDIYSELGGNHGLQELAEYCKNNLDIEIAEDRHG